MVVRFFFRRRRIKQFLLGARGFLFGAGISFRRAGNTYVRGFFFGARESWVREWAGVVEKYSILKGEMQFQRET